MAETVYIRIKLEWDYVHRTVTLSIPSYVRKALHRFQHILRGGKEYKPHTCAPIQYGQKVQYADPWMKQSVSQIKIRTLFNKCAGLSYIMPLLSITPFFPALSNISSEQSKTTRNTEKQTAKLLNYLASNPHA